MKVLNSKVLVMKSLSSFQPSSSFSSDSIFALVRSFTTLGERRTSHIKLMGRWFVVPLFRSQPEFPLSILAFKRAVIRMELKPAKGLKVRVHASREAVFGEEGVGIEKVSFQNKMSTIGSLTCMKLEGFREMEMRVPDRK